MLQTEEGGGEEPGGGVLAPASSPTVCPADPAFKIYPDWSLLPPPTSEALTPGDRSGLLTGPLPPCSTLITTPSDLFINQVRLFL